ncbi:MAG: hypothetical protein ACLQQ4_05405 [Bacteroidia bacterium]
MEDLETRVNLITESLEKGQDGPAIAKEYSKKWGLSERTIRGYITTAKEALSERNRAKQAIIEEVRKEAIAKAAKEQVISDLEIEAILCSIIKGEYELEKEKLVEGKMQTVKCKPNHYDVILAADKLWKKRGSYPGDKTHAENQTLVLQYNLQRPEDIKYIEAIGE